MYLSKQNFIKRKLEILQETNLHSTAKSFEESVGILVNSDEFSDFGFLKNLALTLAPDAPVQILAYSKNARDFNVENVEGFSNSDFKLWGAVKSANLIDFTAKPFRFLISYYQRENVFLDFLKASSQAAFKIGFQQGVSDRFQDLTIQTHPDQTEVFKTEIIKYLKIVNRID
ncbi:DUF6913 domain-containing protein [Leeuwenhoekiella nanhaiensis]|uniref:Uncharacterized protein n=1 Tax=Leeuwenhoekiella nanhaiensis TaxID=1655491 RepID=A0A2G1VQE6_9FLAO|nr:hypothetical protein [Leeuwenhoekiella nanhaiensis]PHQ28996.1 hypothetical protein CJ305_12460 [Leeuwenhoekiella nanhaiensis]